MRIAAALIVLSVLRGNALAQAQPLTVPDPPKVEADDPLRTAIWDDALDAGTNIRYWSALAERAETLEWRMGVASVVSLLFAIAFPLAIVPQIKSKKLRWLTIGTPELIGVLAVGLSLVQMLNQSATHNQLASIHSRWTTLKPEFDELFEISHTLTHDELSVRYDSLKKAKHAIVPIEPAGKDELLMHRSWVEEMSARGIDAEFIAKAIEKRETLGLPH